MTKRTIRLGVLPIGDVPALATKTIVGHILGYLRLDSDILRPLGQPDYAYDERRLQFNAATILQAMESESFSNYNKILGVVDVDLFVPVFTHVFGEAIQGGKYGLVSLYRLRQDVHAVSESVPIFLERAAKVALHELGHLFNLFHCADEKCVMHFSGEIQHLDNSPLYFCRYCALYFRDAVRRQTKDGVP